MDPAIETFLTERKAVWLKGRAKESATDEERTQYEEQAFVAFSLAKWLPDAARRAKQLSVATHLGKFSHPDAKISSVIAKCERKSDGYLRSGNVAVELDVCGNAAAIDVYKFLNLRLTDNQTILSHLEQQTPIIKEQFDLPDVSFKEIMQGLLAVKKKEAGALRTSEKVKQVYFPIKRNEYHLLSILTPSALVFKLKERINKLRFSPYAKAAFEAKKANKYYEIGVQEIEGLSMIGYGGTKPQNISVLNNQNGGVAYLLASIPPDLSQFSIQPPKTNFFGTYLDLNAYQNVFEEFHQLMIGIRKANDLKVRKKRDECIQNIICRVADQLWQIRHLDGGWSGSPIYRKLPRYQKIWLDQFYINGRENRLGYLILVKQELANWFVYTYDKILGSEALNLSGREVLRVREQIERCEEALR